MKTMINMKRAVVTLLSAGALAGLWACDADPVETGRGTLPDKEPLENTYVKIRSAKSTTEFAVVSLSEGTSATFDRIYCRLNRPAEKAMTVTAVPDPTMVDACNEKYGTELLPLPVANVNIEGDGKITVAAGERTTDKIKVSFKADGLAPGTYLLPIAISSPDVEFTEENRVIYYGVKVRDIDLGEYELDTEYLNVFYLNTTKYQPLLANVWVLEKVQYIPPFETEWQRTYGNIANLRVVQIGYDAVTGRAMLVLNSDMRHVLEHADKYIRPLQDKGRKVCLCLEGGSTGLGFCNLTDDQIADFTAQVKACIEEYGLDGVNFFDRNAGYGAEGTENMPATNTTSYPKLIKAMREALGTGKLVTLADYGDPTASFWDTDATGGIKVGEYVDYAWSGYMSEQEDVQLLDPWGIINPADPGLEDIEMNLGVMLSYPTTEHGRKPIAGLPKENYGYFALPFYTQDDYYNFEEIGPMNVSVWKNIGWAPNNIIVWADLITNEQSEYEGAWMVMPSSFWFLYPEGSLEGTYGYNMFLDFIYADNTIIGYDYLKKDW